MSETKAEVQRLLLEEDGETYEIYVESKSQPDIPTPQKPPSGPDSYNFTKSAGVKMQQARKMIRGYTAYALSAFKDFSAAEVEEVTLKFGMKLGGKAGIPYITEGTAESNLAIEVKCKFPPQQQSSSQ